MDKREANGTVYRVALFALLVYLFIDFLACVLRCFDLFIFQELKTGVSLKWQQYKAMFMKRFLNARREKKLVLTQLILPFLMVLLGLLLIKTLQEPSKSEPPRVLNLSNLSIEGVPNTGFYADFRGNVDPKEKKLFFDVS